MHYTTVAAIFLGAVSVAAVPNPQIDWGCTGSCTVWNACRVRNLDSGDLDKCGPEPNRCNCQQFADFKRDIIPKVDLPKVELPPVELPEPVSEAKVVGNLLAERQIDWGCTGSCTIWNACRVRNLQSGDLDNCGPEPNRCNCQQFADFKAKREAEAAPETGIIGSVLAERQIDWGCTGSCTIWNACRVRNLDSGDLDKCGAEPNRCNCQQFADFKTKREAAPAPAPEPEPEPAPVLDARQVDAACTAKCSVWNGCRVAALIKGKGNLQLCGSEPSGCNCQQFADF